ncbi:MAG TPA: DUF4160 domain-containing protein [Caulobacter sp.]|nr:DUF4160 domain-containing protein [Caulobacter sp.]
MPIISVFFGIVIRINFSDHNPPHLHADYQDFEALLDIWTGEVIAGGLPRAAARLVDDWIALNQAALAENWDRAYNDKLTFRIPGLDQE